MNYAEAMQYQKECQEREYLNGPEEPVDEGTLADEWYDRQNDARVDRVSNGEMFDKI